VSRIALLAPDLAEAVLAGKLNQSVALARREKGVPVDWRGQRAIIVPSAYD
jgi:hypothetical protein